MIISSTAERLAQIMEETGMKQVHILRKAKPYCDYFHIKLSKSDLSQFVNGKVKPGQSKLTILSLALDVSEAWLMGFDCDRKRGDSFQHPNPPFSPALSLHENAVIIAYRRQPDKQPAVDKLLGVSQEEPRSVASGSNAPPAPHPVRTAALDGGTQHETSSDSGKKADSAAAADDEDLNGF